MRPHTECTPHVRDISLLIEAVPVAGPPAVLLAVPWILIALVLAGPFALLFTAALVLVAASAVIAAVAAIAASPYLLVRHLRAVRERHATARADVRAPSPTSVSVPGF
jgi:hypothetical protein